MDWIVTGSGQYGLNFNHFSCWPVGSCNPPPPPPREPEPEFRYWSDAANWPGNVVPAHNDTVIITSGWKMILDVEETPIYHNLTVYGALFFSDEIDVHLRTNMIFNRMGEIHIGSASAPHFRNAKITLFGNTTDNDILIFDEDLAGGHRVIANLNVLKMYGTSRIGGYNTRLTQEARKGDTEIYVDNSAGIFITKDDILALAATSYNAQGGEEVVVQDYDFSSGKVTLVEPIEMYHWGQSESTASKYNGVDMRGEVAILTRNIQITANMTANSTNGTLGCSLVAANTFELSASYELI